MVDSTTRPVDVEPNHSIVPIRNLVVPLDGTETSERALMPAQRLSTGFGADVRLITTTMGSDCEADFDYLHACGNGAGMDHVIPEIVLDRFPVEGIVELTDSLPDVALCMATSGYGVAPHVLGGVADEVVRTIQAPVVLIGPKFDEITFTDVRDRMIVGLDGSAAAASILPTVAQWAALLALEVYVVTIETNQQPSCSGVQLNSAVEALRKVGVSTSAHRLIDDAVAEAIVTFGDAVDASLIALAPTGHGGAMNRALGYVATDVVRTARRPVLVQRDR